MYINFILFGVLFILLGKILYKIEEFLSTYCYDILIDIQTVHRFYIRVHKIVFSSGIKLTLSVFFFNLCDHFKPIRDTIKSIVATIETEKIKLSNWTVFLSCRRFLQFHKFTHNFTYSFTISLNHSQFFSHSLTFSQIHSKFYKFTHNFTNSLAIL